MNEAKRDRILVIHSGHPNDFVCAALMRDAFSGFGYRLESFSVLDQQFGVQLTRLLRDHMSEIFCFISFNYAAVTFHVDGQYLHVVTGIPLVLWQFDHPVHFRTLHVPELASAFVVAQGEDSADFVAKYYPGDARPIVNIGTIPQWYEHDPPQLDEFRRRRNEIFCPMNLHVGGLDANATWQQIRALPPARRTFVSELVERLLYDLNTPLHAQAAESWPASLADDTAAALHDQNLAATFLKLWRRERMLRALIDLPLLISTEWVPADLDLRYPQKFSLFSMRETIDLYECFRFTLNANTLSNYTFHDRVMNALHANSVCVTDASVVVQRMFQDDRDMIFFDYAAPERTRERLERYLADTEAAFALTVSAYATCLAQPESFFASYRNLIATVAAHWHEDAGAIRHSAEPNGVNPITL